MTISSGNMLSVLLTPSEAPMEGQMSVQLQAQTASPVSAEGLTQEGQFWAMMNQQLTDIVSQEDVQVIENKDLLAMFEAFETDLEDSGGESGVPTEWMQFMKSHFEVETTGGKLELANETDVKLTPGPEQDETRTAQLTSAINLTQADAVESVVGEELPTRWQGLSVIMPPEAVKNEIKLEPGKISIDAMAAGNGGGTGQEKSSPVTLNNSSRVDPQTSTLAQPELETDETFEPVLEKAKLKQAVAETINMPQKNEFSSVVNKTADVMTAIQANPIASTQPLTPAQALSSQNLPTALQTLQMSTQMPASQWGDALGERVSFLINNKLNNAEIRIDPPHLGKLDIQIQVKDDNAVVHIQTQHALTRDLIDSASARLREFLQEAGYSSVDVNVSHQQQSMAQDGSSDQDNSSSSDPSRAGLSEQSEQVDSVQTSLYLKTDDGRIDYFA